MSPVKIIFLVYFLMFSLFVSLDIGTAFAGAEIAKRSLGKSIISGIIASTDESSYVMGKTLLKQDQLESNARRFLISNMKLDSNLSNRVFKDGHLEVRLQYRSDGAPRVVAIYRAKIAMVSGRIIGLTDYPIEIVKQTPYYAEYK